MAAERHFPVIVTGTHYISGLFALYKLIICRVLRFSCLLFYLDHHVCVFFVYLFQMKERAIMTLGYLPVGDEDFPHQKKLLQGLMDSVEV